MKKMIILSMFLFAAIFAYGQSTQRKPHLNSEDIKSENLFNGIKHSSAKSGQRHFTQKNFNPQQVHWLKSSNETKLGIDSLVIKLKEEDTENWNTWYREEFTYDGWGHLIRSIPYGSEDGITLEANWKSEYSYDTEGRMTQKNSFHMSEYGNQWELVDKEEYSYDANGNITHYIQSGWDENSKQWYPSGKEEFSYDINGNMTQSVEYYNDGQWNPHYKVENSYNENGVLLQSTKYRKDGYAWIPIRKMEYTLDAEGNFIKSLYYNWDEDKKQWYQGWMEEYACDERGNITQNMQCEWEGEQKAYFGKFEYNYDIAFTFSDLLIPEFDDEISIIEALDISVLFKHKLNGFIAYNRESEQSEWSPRYEGNYYYSQHNVSSIKQLEDNSFNIYPNPIIDYITFIIPENYSKISFELFDLQGRRLLKMDVSNGKKISLKAFNQGIYLYILSNAEKRLKKGKLVIN